MKGQIGAVFTPVDCLLKIDQMIELINDSGALGRSWQ
jgi:hypothetical protein